MRVEYAIFYLDLGDSAETHNLPPRESKVFVESGHLKKDWYTN